MCACEAGSGGRDAAYDFVKLIRTGTGLAGGVGAAFIFELINLRYHCRQFDDLHNFAYVASYIIFLKSR